MLSVLLLQTSLLVSPMVLSDEPPESRSLRAILIVHKEIKGVSATEKRTREEARALAEDVRARIAAGADLGELARAHSSHPSASRGGVLGTFFPGMLAAPIDRFLFAAAEGGLSPVLETASGFQIVQRLDSEAGCLQIQLEGRDARQRALDLLARLHGGADFAELARQHSSDKTSAARGGQLGIFQRGSEDSLLRAACFSALPGEVVGPIETPLGFHLVKRVPASEIDPALADDVVARARAILVAFSGASGASPDLERSHPEAERLAGEIARRARAGEDLAALARELNDDRGGRERAGDLGWVRRRTSNMPAFMDRLFTERKGALIGPVATSAGWVVLRRER